MTSHGPQGDKDTVDGLSGGAQVHRPTKPSYGRLCEALYYGVTLPFYGLIYGLITIVGGLFFVIYSVLTIGRRNTKSKQQNKPDLWPVIAVVIFPITIITWSLKALGKSSNYRSTSYPPPPPTYRPHRGSRDCLRLLRFLTRSSRSH